QRVVALERLHLLEHRVAGRRQHTPHDDVADLAAGVAADNGYRALNPHRVTAPRVLQRGARDWRGAPPAGSPPSAEAPSRLPQCPRRVVASSALPAPPAAAADV